MNNDLDLKKVKDAIERQIDFTNVDKRFKQNKKGNWKIHIRELNLKNPIFKLTLQSSILSNISNQISRQRNEELHSLFKESEKDRRKKEDFEEKFRNCVTDTVFNSIISNLTSEDLSTSIFPTSVAFSERPNYYISEPRECYTPTTKLELFNKVSNSICGICGERTYGLYVPEDGVEIRETLESHISDLYNVNIDSLAGVRRINIRQIEPFEYLFYLLDRVLQEMYRKNNVPNTHVELFVVVGRGQGKKFFSHYIIPNLNEIFYKLYHGDEKYSSQGMSKIKALISSFIVENWNVDDDVKEKNSERAHTQINRFLYYLFCYKTVHTDSILFLEELKIKLKDTNQIWFMDEVISWI